MGQRENISMARRHAVFIEVESSLNGIINHAIASFFMGIKKALYPVQKGFCFSQVTKE